MVLFPTTLSDSEILNDTKHCAFSLRQLSFLFMTSVRHLQVAVMKYWRHDTSQAGTDSLVLTLCCDWSPEQELPVSGRAYSQLPICCVISKQLRSRRVSRAL